VQTLDSSTGTRHYPDSPVNIESYGKLLMFISAQQKGDVYDCRGGEGGAVCAILFSVKMMVEMKWREGESGRDRDGARVAALDLTGDMRLPL
jgi:hypothetical protein